MAASLTAFSDDLAALVASVSPRLALVADGEGNRLSGILWRTGLVVTAHEGLGGDDEVTVTLADGTARSATVAGRDPTTDVALLRLDTPEQVDWAPAAPPPVGSLAIVAGRGEHSPTAVLGTVAETGPAWRSLRGGEIDARIWLSVRLAPGAEGGAVLTPTGGLVGMAVTGPGRRPLVIPTSTIARAVAVLADRGYVPRPWLGVSLHPLGTGAGVIVVGLDPEGPAARGGFLVGDIITTYADETITSVADLHDRLSRSAVGSDIELGVERGGSAHAIHVTIGERPRR